ncbi:MAG TPA: hypothetical protein VK137_19150, partial [Planctomycetaceae bacterium]|nr:hypothetical protein [Planctomycetaceae bacterium]
MTRTIAVFRAGLCEFGRLIVWAVMLVVPWSGVAAQGDEKPAPAQATDERRSGSSDSELLRRLLDKVDQLDRDLKSLLKNAPKPIPENPADRKLMMMLETPVMQTFQISSPTGQFAEHRVFAAKLVLINLTPEAKRVEPSQITLDADGNVLKNGDVNKQLENYGLQVGQQGMSLSQLKPTAVKVAPGMTANTWIVFDGLPRGPQIPKMKLSIADGEKPIELDINAWAAAQLDLSSKRLGPRG